jgi:hypothetical protein
MDDFVAWMRGEAHLFTFPVLVLARRVCESVYTEGHACGVDDVVSDTDLGGITRRVAVLHSFSIDARPPILQGTAIIAHPDGRRRTVLGRILRQAGFDPVFAGTGDELLALVSAEGEKESKTRVAVLGSLVLPDSSLSFVSVIRDLAGRASLPHIIVGNEEQYDFLVSEARGMNAVDVISEQDPPDSLLFATNELMRREALGSGVDEQRASTRLLYGTLCAFRLPGELNAVAGYSYNISREGLYIKSLDPPDKNSELWLELTPPGETTAVHLRGEAVWVRGPDHSTVMTAPAGFGMRIHADECPPSDLATYEAAYERFLLRNLRGSIPAAG